MVRSTLFLFTVFLSFQTNAYVSFEEKVNRVDYLKELQAQDPTMDVAAYERELNYEKQDLSLEERAQNESKLIAENIKLQIITALEAALKVKNKEEATIEIREAIERDTALITSEQGEEIKNFSLKVLEDALEGRMTTNIEIPSLQESLMSEIQERMSFLNEEGQDIPLTASNFHDGRHSSRNLDAERSSYRSTAQLLSSLTSTQENIRWVLTSSGNTRSSQIRTEDLSISLNVQAQVMGINAGLGPTLKFEREYSSTAEIMAEGLTPPVMEDGSFDFFHMHNGKKTKRYISFWCEVALTYDTVLSNGASLTVAGIGPSSKISGTYRNSINMKSRRVLVPEFIDGKKTNINDLANICGNPFLNARLTSNLTVKGSLNIQMKNIVKNLRYSHKKSTCGADYQCRTWFKKNLSLIQSNNIPRCTMDSRTQSFMSCEARGLQGQSCPVRNNKGRVISLGVNEFTCDVGLKCVQVSEGGFMKLPKGECRPINPATYKLPRAVSRQ